uniref:Uncharacterized protein n=1 Tax=Arundo donax TaxID=35708 RepID=A0A0A8ZF28_ARUDO
MVFNNKVFIIIRGKCDTEKTV